MFGLSFWEIAAIMAVVLIVFGPSKLPELARNLGKGLREFRKATDDFRSGISAEAHRTDTPRPSAPVGPGTTPAALPAQESDAELVESARPQSSEPKVQPAEDAVARNAEPTPPSSNPEAKKAEG
jgi:TatA/E family protein of Tat protein translocase